jgi:hypothetical protein
MYTIRAAVSSFSLVSREVTNNLFVVGFVLVCSEMNDFFVDVAVTLYFLQLGRAD